MSSYDSSAPRHPPTRATAQRCTEPPPPLGHACSLVAISPRYFAAPLSRNADSPDPTKAPPFPAPDVLPKAPPDFLRWSIRLIKPGNPSSKCFPSRRRETSHALLRNPISEECKSPLNPPDERLVRVLLHPQFPERLVDHSNCAPEAPSRGGQNHPIVYAVEDGNDTGLGAERLGVGV
jgi:hypothetical protein